MIHNQTSWKKPSLHAPSHRQWLSFSPDNREKIAADLCENRRNKHILNTATGFKPMAGKFWFFFFLPYSSPSFTPKKVSQLTKYKEHCKQKHCPKRANSLGNDNLMLWPNRFQKWGVLSHWFHAIFSNCCRGCSDIYLYHKAAKCWVTSVCNVLFRLLHF